MKLRIEISGNELFQQIQGFRPAWYYGFAYRPVNKFSEVYWIYPLNYFTRFWYRLNQFKISILFYLIKRYAFKKKVN